MAQFKQWFEQDFTEKIEIRHCESVMFTGDDNGAIVGVYLYDNGAPYSSGGTVNGFVKRSDGGVVVINGALSGNAASIVLPAAALAYAGPIGVQITLTQGGQVTTILKVIYSVDDTTGTPVDPGDVMPSLPELIAEANAAIAAMQAQANTSIAAVEAKGAETLASIPSDYTALSNVVDGLKGASIQTMFGSISQLKYPNLLYGKKPKAGYFVKYDTGAEVALATWQYYIVPSPGAYVIRVGGGNTQVAFFDKDGNYLSGANTTWQTQYSCVIPQNCAYFTYSCAISDDQYIVIISEYAVELNNSPVADLGSVHVNIGNLPEIVKPRKNLFNKNVILSGGYIDYSEKGSFVSNANYSFCPWFIPAKPSTKYKPNTYCVVSEYDKNYNWLKCENITTVAALNNTPFTTHANCAYVRISCFTSAIDTFMLEEGEASTAYAPFQMCFVGDDETEVTNRTIVVAADGSGNYTTISAACGAANDGDTIYIRDGVYYESVKINGLNVHLVGESREKTILKYLGTQYANPPLEMSNGSIENMTIWAITEQGATGGGGYCLHCDNALSANKYLTCRNVKFQNDYYQVIGIGLQPNFILTFEDCEFIGQVYVHDSSKVFDTLTGQVIRFVNCSFSADNQPLGAIRMQSQERSGAYATALFQRCIVRNTGQNTLVYMGLWDSGETLAKDGWLGSTDWHLDGMSALNSASVINAQ